MTTHAPVKLDASRIALDVALDGPRDTQPRALLTRLVDRVATAPGVPDGLDRRALVERLMDREGDRETPVHDGAVWFHARVQGCPGPRVSVVRTAEPLEWAVNATDVAAVRLAFLVVSPASFPGLGLRLVHQWEAAVSDPIMRRRLMTETDAQALADWIDATIREKDHPLTAEEIMRPSLGRVDQDLPLRELTRLLVAHNLDTVGITDEDRKLVGEVSADHIFTLGMPEFFRQLKSVGFIAEYDPLQVFFEGDNGLTLSDVMTEPRSVVPPSATVLEVLFLLSVKRFSKVYVVDDDGVLLGVIDRIRVLDRVLNA